MGIKRWAFAGTAAMIALLVGAGFAGYYGARQQRGILNDHLRMLAPGVSSRQGKYELVAAQAVQPGERLTVPVPPPAPPPSLWLRFLDLWHSGRNRTTAQSFAAPDEGIAVCVRVPIGGAIVRATAQGCDGTAAARAIGSLSVWGFPDNWTVLLLPTDYPAGTQWLDVKLVDGSGVAATWRLTNLPPPAHQIAPPVAPSVTAEVARGRVRGEASLRRDVDGLWIWEGASFVSPPKEFRHWRLIAETPTKEWEPAHGAPHSEPKDLLDSTAPPNTTSAARMRRVYGGDRWVRGQFRLQEYEQVVEKVTFTNLHIQGGGTWPAIQVPTAQTATTPSGLKVTLPKQNVTGAPAYPGLVVNVPSAFEAAAWPRSPLSRLGALLVRVDVAPRLTTEMKVVALDGHPAPASGGNVGLIFDSRSKRPATLARLTIALVERADLRSVGFQLTMPLAPRPPHP